MEKKSSPRASLKRALQRILRRRRRARGLAQTNGGGHVEAECPAEAATLEEAVRRVTAARDGLEKFLAEHERVKSECDRLRSELEKAKRQVRILEEQMGE